jgi:hypothetical protein
MLEDRCVRILATNATTLGICPFALHLSCMGWGQRYSSDPTHTLQAPGKSFEGHKCLLWASAVMMAYSLPKRSRRETSITSGVVQPLGRSQIGRELRRSRLRRQVEGELCQHEEKYWLRTIHRS